MLTLSGEDQRRISRAGNAVASLLDHEDLGAWGHAVNVAMKELTGAERAALVVPKDGLTFLSDDYDERTFQRYAEVTPSLQRRWDAVARATRLAVYNRRLLWEDRPEYYESLHYNEYVREERLFDTVGLSERTSLGPPSDMTALVQYFLNNEKPRGADFDERALQLLRFVQPSFRAATRLLVALHDRHAELGAMIDRLPHGMLLYDALGRVVHENRVLTDALARDPEASRIRLEAKRLACEVCSPPRSDSSSWRPPNPMRELRTAVSFYRLSGANLAETMHGPRLSALVCVEPHGSAPESVASLEQLQRRFGLTTRQAEVAQLLAARLSNREIADVLGISRHTAKRHTEQVLLKLHVERRGGVLARISAYEANAESDPRSGS